VERQAETDVAAGGVEVIQVSSDDRMGLTRFLDALAPMHIEEPALTDYLLIRA
jgi:hypothetical protein